MHHVIQKYATVTLLMQIDAIFYILPRINFIGLIKSINISITCSIHPAPTLSSIINQQLGCSPIPFTVVDFESTR